MNKKEDLLVVTLGGNSATPEVVAEVAPITNIFRINGSHVESTVSLDELCSLVTIYAPDVPIAYDTCGRETKTAAHDADIYLKVGEKAVVGPYAGLANGMPYIILKSDQVLGQLQAGSNLSLFDGNIGLQVLEKAENGFLCNVTAVTSKLPMGKKVSVQSPDVEIEGPLLTPKDEEMIEHIHRVINRDRRVVEWFFLSHACKGKEVEDFRPTMDAGQKCCAKPESVQALEQILQLAEASDMVMVPGGDLRQAVGDDLPYQEALIIRITKAVGRLALGATGRGMTLLNGGRMSQGEEAGLWRLMELGADGVMDSDPYTLGIAPAAVALALRRCLTAFRRRNPF